MTTLGSKLSLLKYVPYYVLAGIQLWIDRPRMKGVKVQVDPARPDAPGREGELAIRFQVMIPGGTSFSAGVTVDRATKQIVWRKTSDWLFGKEHQGSAAIGIFIVTLPVTLPLSPALLALNAMHTWREGKTGMSRHASALLDALRDQLSRSDYDLLVEACRNQWRAEQRVEAIARQTLTFDEAEALLDTCYVLDEIMDYSSSGAMVTLHRRNWCSAEEGTIARMEWEEPSEEPLEIQIRGSHFIGTEAIALRDCGNGKREVMDLRGSARSIIDECD